MKSNEEKTVVSVIVPVFNAQETLHQCLNSLVAQECPDYEVEIIAVDNNSQDRSLEILKEYDQIKTICCSIPGPAAARNYGVKEARGEFLLFTDSDCVTDSDWVQKIVTSYIYLQKDNSKIGLVGGGIRGINYSIWAVLDDICSWNQFHPRLRQREIKQHLPSANICISKKTFLEIGGFNEQLRYSEDYILSQTLIQSGYRIFFIPKASIGHINRKTLKEALFHSREWTSSHLSKLKLQYIKPTKYGFLYYSTGTLFLLFRTLYFGLISGRFYSVLFIPFISINHILKSFNLWKMERQFKRSKDYKELYLSNLKKDAS